MRPVLLLPGIHNSGPGHWQTAWEQHHPLVQRVAQRDWDNPACAQWVASLEQAVRDTGPEVILVAHSLACLVVAHWAVQTTQHIHAALLVAVPDPAGPEFPTQATGFAPVPGLHLPFKTTMVASTNDPYGSTEYATACAADWGAELVRIGAVGHINSASGLGDWPAGWDMVNRWRGT